MSIIFYSSPIYVTKLEMSWAVCVSRIREVHISRKLLDQGECQLLKEERRSKTVHKRHQIWTSLE